MISSTLVTGATGLLGRALMQSVYDAIACSTKTFNVCDADATMAALVKYRPATIIHCAAIGSVDKVQTDIKTGYSVNLTGTLNVINGARAVGANLVMISTNAVFDGRSPLYDEESFLCPVSNYGIIKAAAEFAVKTSGLKWMIMRPILMYGHNGASGRGNWVTTWVNAMREGKECQVVDDVTSQPLYNHDCANVIQKAIAAGMWGEIFNVGGGDRCTLYEFAQKVADVYGYDRSLIKPVPSSHFANIAPRPRDCSYDLRKISTALRHVPCSIYDGLSAMKKEN